MKYLELGWNTFMTIAIMSMLDYILTTHYMWMSSFMPWTLVYLMISNHLQGSQMTPGPVLGSKLTPGTLLRDYFKEPLVRLIPHINFLIETSLEHLWNLEYICIWNYFPCFPALYALESVNAALECRDAKMLLKCLKLPHLGLKDVKDANAEFYLNRLLEVREYKQVSYYLFMQSPYNRHCYTFLIKYLSLHIL